MVSLTFNLCICIIPIRNSFGIKAFNSMTFKKRMINFLESVLRSCYDLEFYRRVRVGTVGAALRYAVVFCLLLTLIFVLTVVLPGVLQLSRLVNDGLSDKLLPGSSFEISQGQFNTNLLPGTEFNFGDLDLVVDPTVEGNEFPLAFSDRTGVFFGHDSVFVQRSDGQREITPFSDLPDLSVTREEMQNIVFTWKWPVVAIILVLATIFRFLFSFLILMVDVVVISLLALLFSRIFHLKLTFVQWLSVGFYAITLPTLIDHVFGVFLFGMPFASTVVFLMFMLAVALDERARPAISNQTSLDLSH